MLCKELQFGDWIADNNGFRWQIICVGDDYAYATFEGNEGDPWEFDDKDDQPEGIPLAKEMLDDNGFRYEKDYGPFYRSILGSYSKDKEPLICVQWNPQGEISHWEVSNKSGILTGVVAYGYTEIAVHELQHILRMVGLNNIADNFKV